MIDLEKTLPFLLTLKGKLEDTQEVPAAEAAPGVAVAASVSVTVCNEDRSVRSPSQSPSTSDPAPQCSGYPKEDTGENTALLGE